MRKGRIVISSLSVLMLTAIMAASTGFTVVTHVCKMCGVSSIQTEYLFDKSSAADPCCDNPADQDQSQMSIKGEQCCTFHVEQLKVNNYLPQVYHAPIIYTELLCNYSIEIVPEINEQSDFRLPIACEKYGGGSILNFCHQLLI